MIKKLLVGASALATLGGGGAVIADQAINPYTDKGTSFEIAATSTIPEAGRVKTELAKEAPAITLSKWNGEAAMTVRYDDVKAAGSRAFLTDRMEWKDAKQEVHAYPLEARAGMEDGGFEIEVVLKEKPDTNVFHFPIEGADDLDFFYQPALTQADVDDGLLRPDNVVGSYAVYHKDHANHRVGDINYATGKAYHIYRPKAVDAKGNETWAELNIENDILSVTVPQEFLENAAYPVAVDPTFGNTVTPSSVAIRTSVNTHRSVVYAAVQYTASAGDTITSYSGYGQCTVSGSGTAGVSAYTFSGGVPVTRLGTEQTITFNTTFVQWNNSPTISTAMSPGTTYIVAYGNWDKGTCTNLQIGVDTVTAGDASLSNATGALPVTWANSGTDANRYGFYATYTAGAAGGAPAVNDTTQMWLDFPN